MKTGHPKARPFLKWAGGKTQLLPSLSACLPDGLACGEITRYVEPFVGSGALFFHIARRYQLSDVVLQDRNDELILAYKTIKFRCPQLVDFLSDTQSEYRRLTPDEQKDYYYRTRADFNAGRESTDFSAAQPGPGAVKRTGQLIFLNRTCYNGLFRVNSKGEFNVPFGRYKNPRICDAANLRAVSMALQGARIQQGDFEGCRPDVDAQTFVYFDPPYRPLTRTASFTAYSTGNFGDAEQNRLAGFFRELDFAGAKLMLSNSDPRNADPADEFFDALYAPFHIYRVKAHRMINSNPTRRGPITEILVTNYPLPL